MSRASEVTTHHDSAGAYEVEVFDAPKPKRVFVTAHGNGVRRWDGKHFFHKFANYYADSTVMLVDQNQPDGEGCRLNTLQVMAARVQGLLTEAARLHPGVPVVIAAHSMGCGVTAQLDLSGVAAVVFVTPGAGDAVEKNVKRYGKGILDGKTVTTSDGLRKVIPKEYLESVKEIVWEKEYRKLLKRFQPIYCFEAGEEEIVNDHRFEHRDMPFADYQVIPHARHNLEGAPLQDFLSRLDKILSSL
jgi:hypothetical protein